MIRDPFALLRVESLEAREVPAILFGVTPGNVLVTFDSANPSALLRASRITGLVSPGEVIADIDVRPGTGVLYGRSNFGRLYFMFPQNGSVLAIGAPVQLNTAFVGFDFDSRNDRIRALGSATNVMIEPTLGTVVRFGNAPSYVSGDRFASQSAQISGAAFVNPVPFPTFTGFYAIDDRLNTLAIARGTLDSGLLGTVGSLGVNVTPRVGFDIAPQSNAAFASLQVAGQRVSQLFVVNLGSGRAVSLGTVGRGFLLNDIAVDLRGVSGFTSASGFAALPPSQGTTFSGFGTPGFTSPSIVSPFGPSLSTTPAFPTLSQPLSPTLG